MVIATGIITVTTVFAYSSISAACSASLFDVSFSGLTTSAASRLLSVSSACSVPSTSFTSTYFVSRISWCSVLLDKCDHTQIKLLIIFFQSHKCYNTIKN